MAFRRRKLLDHAGDLDQLYESIQLCVAFAHRSTYALIETPASDRVSAVFGRTLNRECTV